jgi:hypothetical protein
VSGAWRRARGLAASSERVGLRPPSLSRFCPISPTHHRPHPTPEIPCPSARLSAAPVAAEWPTHNTRIMEVRLAELRACSPATRYLGQGTRIMFLCCPAQSSMELCRPSALADAASCLAPLAANLSFFLPYHTTRLYDLDSRYSLAGQVKSIFASSRRSLVLVLCN